MWRWRKRTDEDFCEEIRANIALDTDRLIAEGMSPEDARAAALRAFGNVTRAQERFYESGRMIWLDDLQRDVRYAFRTLVKNRGFTVVAVLTLALGIGANTAIFSVVNAILLRPLPYKDSDRVVHIITYRREGEKTVRAWDMGQRYFVGLRERTQTLSAVGGYDSFSNLTRQRLSMMVEGREGAAQLFGTRMSPVLFSMLGARPEIGRVFEPTEEQPDRHDVIILSHRAWIAHYGGDANILSKPLTLDHRLYSVVGVMPRDFQFPDRQTDFWIPLTPAPVPPPSAPRSDSPNSGYTDGAFGQLADGISAHTASAEVESIIRQLDVELATERRWSLTQLGFPGSLPRRAEIVSMKEELVGRVRPALRVLSFAVAFVLLIACANVLTLLLSRIVSRQRELAIRTALGAARSRLIRQVLTESLVIASAGGVAGIVLASWLIQVIIRLAPADIPRIEEVGMNVSVLLFTLALSSLTGVVSGLLPAMRAGRTDQPTSPTQSNNIAVSPDSVWLRFGSRRLIVVGEIAMAMMLFIGAGLLIRSFVTLVNVNPGYDARNVLTFQVVLPPGRFADPREFYDQLIARLESVPMVQSVGATDVLPIAGSGGFHFSLGGLPTPPGPSDTMVMRVVTRNYFSAMGIRVIEGRPFSDRDGVGGRRSILVNREFAQRYFGLRNPVGWIVGQAPLTYEVIGVVDDVRHAGLQAEIQPEYYVDLREFALSEATRPYFAVRTRGDTADLVPTIRSVVRQIDARAGVDLNLARMSDIVSASVTRPRFYTALLSTFAAIAVALAVIGIYGVMAHSVAQRTREIGIRVALGARRSQILALVLRQGIALTLAGICIGLAGAAAITRYLEGMLFGLTPLDPATFVAVSVMLAMIATAASYVPARRATKVDPLVALRCE
jgi:putative ABC transport system permease protein